MSTTSGWAPRDRRAADRMGALVLLGGALLHTTLLVWLSTPPGALATFQWFGALAKAVMALWAWRCAGRLPTWLWPAELLLVQPLFCVQLFVLDDQVLLAAPLLVMVTVFASHWLGRTAARVIVVQSVLLTAVAIGPSGEEHIGIVAAVFVSGVLVVLHLLLVAAADEHEQLVATLTRAARTDTLTGWLNRGAFDAALADAAPGASLLVVDVDQFKGINDTYGHPVGDRALQHVAATLATRVRDEDAVLGRLGGDEFAVLLHSCPPEVAVQRAEELRAALRDTPLELADGELLTIGVTVGSATAPESGAGGLYEQADLDLYSGKRGAHRKA